MTPRDLTRPIERITWRDGQTLTSADMRDDQSNTHRFRHLHIRYQHKAWGVVTGLHVMTAGPATVIVSPGYALDIEGRELLLPRKFTIAAPTVSGANITMYLVISWNAAPGTCSPPLDLTILCPGALNSIAIEEGLISWKTVNQVRVGYDVLLARVLVSAGQFNSKIDASIQRRPASMNQPKVWSDVTQAGQTGWTNLPARTKAVAEISATVDSSDAGFVSTPAYFAQLTGASQLAQGYITASAPDSFTFSIRPPASLSKLLAFIKRPTASSIENEGWTIAWTGVELQKG